MIGVLCNPYKQPLNKMSRYICRHCMVEIMVAAWNTRERHLAGTLSQAAILKVAEPFYKLCLRRTECYSTALFCASQVCIVVIGGKQMLRGSDGIIALTVHSMWNVWIFGQQVLSAA